MAKQFEVKTRLTVEDDASATIQGVEKSLGNLEKSTISVTAALGVAAEAFALLAVATKASVSSAAEEQEALAKLDSALRLTGTTQFAKALRDQAAALQATTRFSDDAVNSAQALIATYGVAGEQLELATQAAVDLSARLGIDLNTAAQQVAATTNGVTRGLERVVPALKAMGDEALKAGEGVIVVADAMRGGAVEAAQTFRGEIVKTTNAFNEMLASFGRAAIESEKVKLGFQFLRGLFGALSDDLGTAEKAVIEYGDAFAHLIEQQEASIRTVTQLAEIQDRSTRIMSENATSMSRAAALAAQYGITLQSQVNVAEQQRIADLAELDRLLRITGDSIAHNTNLLRENSAAVVDATIKYDALNRVLSVTSQDGRFVTIPNTQGTFNGPVVNGGGFGSGGGHINAQSALPPIVR